MKFRKLVSCISAIAILASLSFTTFADDYIQEGSSYGEVRASPHYSLTGGFFNTTDIKYTISYSPSSEYTTAINDAVNMWNNSTSLFSLRKGTSTNYNINVVPSNWGYRDWNAQSSISDGTWSTTYNRGVVRLNTYFLDGQIQKEKKVVTAHELGHLFGLDHVSYTDVLMYVNGAERAAKSNTFLYSRPGNDDINGAEINCNNWH